MKKYLLGFQFVLLSLFVILIFCTCQKTHKLKIGFLLSNLKDDRYINEKLFFGNRIIELGGEPIIYSAELDDKLQIAQAKQCIDQGATVLVVNAVNLNTAGAIVRLAHQKGIKVIGYDRMIFNSDLDCFISFDGGKIGKLMADYITRLKPEGTYILLGGDKSDLNASLVKNGQLDILEPYIKSGKIKIGLDVFVEEWSSTNAKHEIKRYITFSGGYPDAIIASNDGIAAGAIEALKEFDLAAKVLVTGQDAQLEACRYIVQGYQTMTIYKSSKSLVYKTVDLAVKLSREGKLTDTNAKIFNGFKDVPSILLEPLVVDKDNLKSTVIADGGLKEEEIYK